MTATMASRIRLIIDTEEELRRAVQIRAAVTGVSPSEVMNDLIREHFRAEISQARRAIKEESGTDEAG
jgi:hypothetical protein